MSYDNACKFMADRYPGDFIRHFFSVDTSDVSILKTELTIEPIRADSVAFIQTGNRIAHLEFETLPKSDIAPQRFTNAPLFLCEFWIITLD